MTKATSVPAGVDANVKGNVNTNEATCEKQLSARDSHVNSYANTAYSSEMWKQQPHNKKHTFSGMFELAVNDIRNVIPDGYLNNTHEIIHSPVDEAEQAEIPFRFDHEKICTVKGTRDFFAIICTLGGYITLFLGIATAIVQLFLMILDYPERLKD